MHTQTESVYEHRAGITSLLAPATGLGLYLLTLSGEVMPGASVRWLLVYLGAAIAGTIVPFGVSAEALAWVAALTPIAWSVIGLVLPGRGRVWGRRLGARRASAEEAIVVGEALELLRSADPSLPERLDYYVLDDPLPAAAVRGRTMILSRGLIESDSLASVLAHELGHADTLDGRLTEALNRLAIWDDPLGPARAKAEETARSSSRSQAAACSGAARAGRCASAAAASPSGCSTPFGRPTGAPASTQPTPTPPRSARPRTWPATSPTTSGLSPRRAPRGA